MSSPRSGYASGATGAPRMWVCLTAGCLPHGGVFLRSANRDSGIVLIIRSNGDLYWHRRWAGHWGNKLGLVSGVSGLSLGADLSLRVEVIGST